MRSIRVPTATAQHGQVTLADSRSRLRRVETLDLTVASTMTSVGAGNLQVGEDVGRPVGLSGAISAVRPDRIDHLRRGGEAVVVSDETATCEETLVSVPGLRADVEVGPGFPVVRRECLERFEQNVVGIVAVVVPNRVEVSSLVRRN